MTQKLVIEFDLDLLNGSKEEILALIADSVLPNVFGFPQQDLRELAPAIEEGAEDVPLAIWSLVDIEGEEKYVYSLRVEEGELPPLPENFKDESIFEQVHTTYSVEVEEDE